MSKGGIIAIVFSVAVVGGVITYLVVKANKKTVVQQQSQPVVITTKTGGIGSVLPALFGI